MRISNAPEYRHSGQAIPGLSASTARDTSDNLRLALVNPDPNTARQVRVGVQGGEATSARGRVLTAGAMDAHNSFGQPEAVRPSDYTVDARAGRLVLELPPKSVVVVAVD